LNSDENSKITLGYSISSIPTLILFSKGKEIARMTGAKPEPAILAWIDEHIDLSM